MEGWVVSRSSKCVFAGPFAVPGLPVTMQLVLVGVFMLSVGVMSPLQGYRLCLVFQQSGEVQRSAAALSAH